MVLQDFGFRASFGNKCESRDRAEQLESLSTRPSAFVTIPVGGIQTSAGIHTSGFEDDSTFWGEHALSSGTASLFSDCDCLSVTSSLSCGSTSDNSQNDTLMTEENSHQDYIVAWDRRLQGSMDEACEEVAVIPSTCGRPTNCYRKFDNDDHALDNAIETMSVASSSVELFSIYNASSVHSQRFPYSKKFPRLIQQHQRKLSYLTSHENNTIAPFSDLPDELVSSITSFLDVPSLVRVRSVCKRFLIVASRDEAGWKNHCKKLWSQKAHVSSSALSKFHSNGAIDAYQNAFHDGKFRNEILKDELCYDPISGSGKGIIWSFRFKETAGSDWTSWDPWWNHGEARKMVFLRDGTVKQLVPSIETSSLNAPLEMKWRMISKPMDLPSRPNGAYIRLTIGGRDVPTYIVHRSPTGNWGFVMESCWGVYSSFGLPPRELDAASSPRQRRRMRMRLRRTRDGGRWFNVAGKESDSEDECDVGDTAPTEASLLDDSALSVTNCWQWRETLLYNHGAMSLPEGEGATAEFERVWRDALYPILQDPLPLMEQDMHSFFGGSGGVSAA